MKTTAGAFRARPLNVRYLNASSAWARFSPEHGPFPWALFVWTAAVYVLAAYGSVALLREHFSTVLLWIAGR